MVDDEFNVAKRAMRLEAYYQAVFENNWPERAATLHEQLGTGVNDAREIDRPLINMHD